MTRGTISQALIVAVLNNPEMMAKINAIIDDEVNLRVIDMEARALNVEDFPVACFSDYAEPEYGWWSHPNPRPKAIWLGSTTVPVSKRRVRKLIHDKTSRRRLGT